MLRTSLRLPWLGLVILVGCQQPPDISGQLDEYTSYLNSVVDRMCDCPQDFGFDTGSECADALGYVDLEDRKCLDDAAEGHEEVVKQNLDCVNVALEGYVECLEADPGCMEGWFDDCTIAYQDERDACPQLPDSVRQDFGFCTT